MIHTTLKRAAASALLFPLAITAAQADWRGNYPVVTIGATTAESQAATIDRFQPLADYFEEQLGVQMQIQQASDYSAVVQALTAGHVQLARLGGSSYAAGWIDSDGGVEPLVVPAELDGELGYHSVLIVRSDSEFESIDDLQGRSLAWADPNSTSGYLVPLVSLREDGIEPNDFFGNTVFSGGHEQSVIGVLNGSLDSAFTWTSRGDNTGQLRMMIDRGMLDREDIRVIWESPLIPNPPYVVNGALPEEMKQEIADFFMTLHEKRPDLADAAASGRTSGFVPATHEMYEPILGAVQELRDSRRQR
ncbi:phosphonate ABC transporter substrate-binding protein [Billgrantia kenyensis]|uniref:Phosphonate ABC transporter substrate-binding protein n=1 Tax=Billgrantia kenyensis TaxID=321266 RepID=A0A7V9W1N2_9GAMM|nr:phosphonate ABC transporter substrate-binding protein [Halomonas kenyensis]MBA2779337.1 phosphonate ABC transporter substrate-binding protein [Halomonas kenyensis]MCG6662515.1 phosphonate ABC transporter substrate-binding protein [Halomonas kenyensis]